MSDGFVLSQPPSSRIQSQRVKVRCDVSCETQNNVNWSSIGQWFQALLRIVVLAVWSEFILDARERSWIRKRTVFWRSTKWTKMSLFETYRGYDWLDSSSSSPVSQCTFEEKWRRSWFLLIIHFFLIVYDVLRRSLRCSFKKIGAYARDWAIPPHHLLCCGVCETLPDHHFDAISSLFLRFIATWYYSRNEIYPRDKHISAFQKIFSGLCVNESRMRAF
jgi:hypothetical protein